MAPSTSSKGKGKATHKDARETARSTINELMVTEPEDNADDEDHVLWTEGMTIALVSRSACFFVFANTSVFLEQTQTRRWDRSRDR